MRRILIPVFSLIFLGLGQAADPPQEHLIGVAQSQAAAGELKAAAAKIGAAIEQEPDVFLHQARARILSRLGQHESAAADYTAAIALADDRTQRAGLLQSRGVEHFFAGQAKASVADFDAFLKENPRRAPYHWQRGLSLYYAGDFDGSRKQFEIHQKVNSRDVENAVWHFLCVARLKGVETAREHFIPIEGDRRVPMAQIHQLFAGEGTPREVIAAVQAAGGNASDKRDHLCYAHLYLGLYFEALGESNASLVHIKKAAVDYKMDHYMGKTAQVHWRLRRPKPR